MKNNRILALSGNDIFSGGGLSADLATYTLNGLHGFVAVTCLTALTEKGFEVFPTDDTIFQHELDSLRDVLRAFFYTNRRKGVKMIFK
ncbi:phosphomethylpyrimidine kinase [Streptococcus pneumoniae]|uniref:Phosphomethylpyrimidine kinase n=1 Tax=Streptococcus pneumoniae TaxID=1313 RepID=A0A4H5CWP8_STREE|nr:phosphomethylpyrimidine kinase [Streptococcus pneumoniae CDC1873-00]EDT96972.1 phosphomethylpyrimidine kinase [Streptococcus pneumoniae CDC3059-06]EHE07299.1 phosphomethylpyrimidine kinase [Streptococcus pneumoniae GA17328]EHE20534.1 phosphomethylpyrimidine kinase [Streptococcus pneumoniae GA41437]EHE53541.1 phosphomethylpyrimidine kinase [Streptococcus pneumoniae NP127]EHE71878.1 phosphomethylpyrimidine kinase [Streptococcus pneumoniae NorthCarolina6A-23]EHY95431.1 phosphomethylpyrimidine